GRVVLGEHPLHPVDADGVAVGDVDDDFEDRPVAGSGSGGELLAGQSGGRGAELGGAGLVGVDRLRVHVGPLWFVGLNGTGENARPIRRHFYSPPSSSSKRNTAAVFAPLLRFFNW